MNLTKTDKILIDRKGQRFGPYTLQEANALLISGQLHPSDLAWPEGAISWVPLRSLEGAVRVPETPRTSNTDKKILPIFLLAFFLGCFGIHRFYVGKIGTGVAQLVLTLTLVGVIVSGIWATVDWIMAVCGVFTDKDGNKITEWT
jgi:TM2 domain-containing membrane protein YozV